MFLKYFALLGIFALQNVDCYSAHRYPRLTTAKNANNPQEVIPARYKIKGKQIDPTIGQNIHADNFPEVEYPSSITDVTKPFYLNVSPFSNDVKSNFKSLVSAPSTKTPPTIVVNLKKDNNKPKSQASEKLDVDEATIDKGNKNNTERSDKTVNETPHEEPSILDNEDGISRVENIDNQSEEETDCEEMDYIFGIIDDLDDFISTFTAVETEIIDMNSNSTKVFDSDHPKEFVTITSDMTSVNDESVTELNEEPLHTEPAPLMDASKDFSITESPNEEITPTSFSDEMQGDSGSIGKIANDNNSSWIEQ